MCCNKICCFFWGWGIEECVYDGTTTKVIDVPPHVRIITIIIGVLATHRHMCTYIHTPCSAPPTHPQNATTPIHTSTHTKVYVCQQYRGHLLRNVTARHHQPPSWRLCCAGNSKTQTHTLTILYVVFFTSHTHAPVQQPPPKRGGMPNPKQNDRCTSSKARKQQQHSSSVVCIYEFFIPKYP